MRILVLFDLPVRKSEERKHYSRFHKFLIRDGYDMLQYSIYSRICAGMDTVDKHMRRLEKNLPPRGAVRAMIVTEKQYQDMKILIGTPTPQEDHVGGRQLSLF